MSARLVVNVDHVATVRQARLGTEPDPVAAATLALVGGADGIVAHLREDRRHMQDRDIRVLRQVVHGRLCLEMASTPLVVEPCTTDSITFDMTTRNYSSLITSYAPGEVLMCWDLANQSGIISYLWEISAGGDATTGEIGVLNNSGSYSDYDTVCSSSEMRRLSPSQVTGSASKAPGLEARTVASVTSRWMLRGRTCTVSSTVGTQP